MPALATATGAVLFGSAYVATAVLLRSFAPLPGAMWRGGAAAVILGLGAALRQLKQRSTADDPPTTHPVPARSRALRVLLVGSTGGLVFIVGMNTAVALVGATVTAFVAGLYAAIAALLAGPILGEPVGGQSMVGFAVALVGTLLLAHPTAGPESLVGLGAGFLAAFSYGLYLVLSRRWGERYRLSPGLIAVANNGTAAVGLFLVLGVSDPAALWPAGPRSDALAALAWLILVSAVAQVLVLFGVRALEARLSAALLLFNPPAATLLAIVVLGEHPGLAELVGAVLVLLGIAVATGIVGSQRAAVTEPVG